MINVYGGTGQNNRRCTRSASQEGHTAPGSTCKNPIDHLTCLRRLCTYMYAAKTRRCTPSHVQRYSSRSGICSFNVYFDVPTVRKMTGDKIGLTTSIIDQSIRSKITHHLYAHHVRARARAQQRAAARYSKDLSDVRHAY